MGAFAGGGTRAAWPVMLALAGFAGGCGRDPSPPPAAASESASRAAVVPLPASAVLPAVPGARRPAAIVELYTSEGCSSCPSADAVANAVAIAARAEKKRVYVLAFHVDYWDDIGWPDPFSDGAYTARQRERSRRAGKRGVYTPEAVVQGKGGFVGSDEAQLRSSVARALETAPSVNIESFTVDSDNGSGTGNGTATWSVSALPAAARVHVAVTEGGLVVKVRSGENAGRELHHEGVVRSFRTTREPRGKLALGALPPRGSVVLFVEGEDGAVLGAEAIDIEGGVASAR